MFIDSPSAVFARLWRKIPRYIKITFSAALILGLLTHVFMMVNKLPNHDDIFGLVSFADGTVSGRWFSQYPDALTGPFNIPWVNGLIALIYLSLAACFVVSCLKIHNSIACILVSGLMATAPFTTATFTFVYSVEPNFFSLTLACFSAWVTTRYKYGFVAAIISLTLSLGGYQVYYGVAVGLLITVAILELLHNKTPWQKTLLDGIKAICVLAVSMVFYLIIVKITTASTGLTSYMGIDQMFSLSISEIPHMILRAYKGIVEFYIGNIYGYFPSFMPVMIVVSILLGCVLLVLCCIQMKLHKEPVRLIMLIILVLILPLGCNIITVLSPIRPHMLMLYGMVLLPVFLVAIMSHYSTELSIIGVDAKTNEQKRTKRKTSIENLICWFISATMVLCIFNFWSLANESYLKMHFAYEQTYAKSVDLMTRIQSIEGYSVDTEIIIVGTPIVYEAAIPEFNKGGIVEVISGEELFGCFSYDHYLRDYLGLLNKIEYLPSGVLENARIAKTVVEMPCYPSYGSVAMIEGKIYVHFSSPS